MFALIGGSTKFALVKHGDFHIYSFIINPKTDSVLGILKLYESLCVFLENIYPDAEIEPFAMPLDGVSDPCLFQLVIDTKVVYEVSKMNSTACTAYITKLFRESGFNFFDGISCVTDSLIH
ncbi:MAG TPA: hypothetical protein VFV22_02590 [Candidatus Paceibacterota bacterium]|nr:hypothetical protein [Candidatus Paceibacterota bacterium]